VSRSAGAGPVPEIAQATAIFLPAAGSEVNPLGIKGIGELGNVGTNAAVANAFYHTPGPRIR
jgi:xanthine dehydrogenase YagR molybdenum-binding subunit